MLRSRRRRSFRFVLVAALAPLAVSCTSGPKLYPVKGQVFFGDKPTDGAQVVFHPATGSDLNARRPSGVVGPDGTFTLSTFAPNDGAPAGSYIVAIVWLPKDARADWKTTELKNRLPDKYADPTQSNLRAEVKPGENNLEPFRLTR